MKLSAEIKLRISCTTKSRLQAEAKAARKEFSQYLRDQLEAHPRVVTVEDVLERLERQITALTPVNRGPVSTQESPRLVRVEALVEEFVMHAAPQTVARVTARLRNQMIAKEGVSP